jgi:hypothetical protein
MSSIMRSRSGLMAPALMGTPLSEVDDTQSSEKGAHGPQSFLCRIPTELAKVNFRNDPHFGVAVPPAFDGVYSDILDPVKTWSDKQRFETIAKKLVECSARIS